MKKITVKYFASIREHLGVSSELVQTDALTLGALREELQALDNLHAEGLARNQAVRMALNQLMCNEATELPDGAEVAFFPPVTGG